MAERDQASSADDPLDSLLSLEDQFHREGYELGVADGARSGRVEGRVFGLEKGFEKFIEMGRLQGRATVWQARLPNDQKPSNTKEAGEQQEELPTLSGSERLKKHIDRLNTLTDLETLSTENDEDDVSEFDDRLKDAKAKATLIEKMVSEDNARNNRVKVGSNGEPNKASRLHAKRSETATKSGEMEDFGGLLRGRS